MKEGEVPLEEVEAWLARDLAGASDDVAEVGAGGDGGIGGGVDLGAMEEGDNVLKVEHLIVELVGIGVDRDELISEKMIKFVVIANVEGKGRWGFHNRESKRKKVRIRERDLIR